MSKKAFLSVAIVALILIVGAGCVTTKKSATNTNTTAGQTPETPKKQSLKDLIGFTGSQQCTFTNSINGAESTGTIYIANKKMRGDFTTTVNGQTTNSHMVTTDNTMYMWTDAMKNGFKFTVDEATKQQSATTATKGNKQSVDINQQMDFHCGTWVSDDSKFALPTNIIFTDYSAMMPKQNTNVNGSVTGSASVKQMQCTACDQVPAESRGECKKALGC